MDRRDIRNKISGDERNKGLLRPVYDVGGRSHGRCTGAMCTIPEAAHAPGDVPVRYDLVRQFAAWITSAKIQKEIGAFRILGKQLFTPNAIE